MRGSWLRQYHPPGRLQHAAETRHRLPAVRYVMRALERQDRVDHTGPNRQVFDVGYDEMWPVVAHSLYADFEIGTADVDADRLDAALVQPLCRPGVSTAAVDQSISGLE